jgi:hypothetical protein
MGKYMIFYRNVLAGRNVTERGAKARAYELAKDKGWNVADIRILEERKAVA